MTSRSKSREVPESPAKHQPRRMPGEVPCPVEYSRDQLALDNWNHMFMKSLARDLTLRSYETPPTNILDLGCGSGLWVIEAAKQWPRSKFVGYDCLKIQPDVKAACASQPGLGDLADRITWVHGNFLEALPFQSNHFDLVRICGIGLGVPEDEWQKVLQEVARILKPGAFVEILEEDLIFPCSADSIKDSDSRPSIRSLTKAPAVEETLPRMTRTISRSSNLTTKSTASRRLASTMALFQNDTRNSVSPDVTTSSVTYLPEITDLLDPRDHTQLKNAWESMLHTRFLAPGLLSVLQFYFSAEFDEVQTYPVVRVILPPNSQLTFDDPSDSRTRSRSTSFTSKLMSPASTHTSQIPAWNTPSLTSMDVDVPGYGSNTSQTQTMGAVSTTSWAPMHLAKVLSTIQGCKEAIWAEYKMSGGQLWTEDNVNEDGLRREFMAAWDNWENDMKDRIGMRSCLQHLLTWQTPISPEHPDWKIWRGRVGYLDDVDGTEPHFSQTDICRSMRGYVGRKPFQRDIPTP